MKVEEFSTLQYRELLLANKVQEEGLGQSYVGPKQSLPMVFHGDILTIHVYGYISGQERWNSTNAYAIY